MAYHYQQNHMEIKDAEIVRTCIHVFVPLNTLNSEEQRMAEHQFTHVTPSSLYFMNFLINLANCFSIQLQHNC